MVWIAGSGVLPANTSSFTFTNIPQTFTHLQIRAFSRSYNDGATYASIYMNPNSDGNGANYKAHFIKGDGASATSGSTTNSIYYASVGNTTAANIFGTAIIDVLDYTNTNKYKTIRTIAGWDANGSGNAVLGSILWMQTTAISSFQIGLDGSLEAGSRFDLYGITTSSVTGA